MATALKLYTADGNLNAITKTISNVNPEASDYTLKDFSVKLMDLSNNDLHKIERVDTKNITSAIDSGGGSGLAIASTSDIFSTNDTAYQNAVSGYTMGNFRIDFKQNGTTQGLGSISLYELSEYANFSEFCKYLTCRTSRPVDKKFEFLADITGKNQRMVFSNLLSGITQIVMYGAYGDETGASFIAEIGTKLIPPSADANYTVTYDSENKTITAQFK